MSKATIPSPVLIVADATESAVQNWNLTVKCVLSLITELSAGAILGIAYLGTQLVTPITDWSADKKIPGGADCRGSFIGPVMASLSQKAQCSTIVIIGTGEVFDLLDWVLLRPDMHWILIRTGNASLLPAGCHISEIFIDTETNTEKLPEELASVLSTITISKPPRRYPLLGRSLPTQWELDKTGYPMVYIPPINGFVHLFPVTKPQFETFLVSGYARDCGDVWYSHLLEDSTPRGSILSFPKNFLESLFITGLRPEEVLTYANWNGAGVRIPTVSEWRILWNWLEGYPDCALPVDVEEKMAPGAHFMWQAILENRHPENVKDLACLSECIWEWTIDSDGKWMGMGNRSSHPFHDPLDPISPPELNFRPRWFGLRLLRKA